MASFLKTGVGSGLYDDSLFDRFDILKNDIFDFSNKVRLKRLSRCTGYQESSQTLFKGTKRA